MDPPWGLLDGGEILHRCGVVLELSHESRELDIGPVQLTDQDGTVSPHSVEHPTNSIHLPTFDVDLDHGRRADRAGGHEVIDPHHVDRDPARRDISLATEQKPALSGIRVGLECCSARAFRNRHRDHGDVRKAVHGNVVLESGNVVRQWLECIDVTRGGHPVCSEYRQEADIRSYVIEHGSRREIVCEGSLHVGFAGAEGISRNRPRSVDPQAGGFTMGDHNIRMTQWSGCDPGDVPHQAPRELPPPGRPDHPRWQPRDRRRDQGRSRVRHCGPAFSTPFQFASACLYTSAIASR